ncbi:type VI protein secretion system component VasK [Angulomicrobium tetraedrale]|uniref:Type VI protein secretion system component VasK n=1 Tax=Ancylobacter tetraedralis TaxID=217068 RepID=A0A839Z5L7_9HYPH|nr:hypothetical protein [Ancylobacter tetraedralis]MBB3769820.1 type VI protein secretion system component VasK [Ancylobacter tetraedralis]
MSWILDLIPWWLWALAGGALLAATWQVWLPWWLALPKPIRTGLAILATGGLAYLAGRNKGAAGALQRAREQEQAHADDIRKRGADARARSDRDAVSGRLRDDDGFRRDR